eukprot:TRINITY_DN104139_c0_g1_i1.p2 TRINITY_DN104139_c0_g1~~TRINITY_DN104139_c0_g1_i1.p2  ORF type:complete len:215 (+),score=110.30 TRINITY_DN104139_c0_g1_i1:30-647(+)
MVRGLMAAYNRALTKRPLLTKMATAAGLFSFGDVLAQKIAMAPEDKFTEKFDIVRNGRMIVVGGVMFAPLAHSWFGILDKLVKVGSPGQQVLKKVALDQAIFGPLINGCFITSFALLEGHFDVDYIAGKFKNDFFDILKVNWVVWPVAQLINFRYVPLSHRVLFVNCVNVGWSAFLSYMGTREGGKEAAAEEEHATEKAVIEAIN